MGKETRFETLMLPYLADAYNLARWMTRSPEDAQDIVQEAMVRAFRFFDGYREGSAKAWLLTIVRNTGYSWLRQNRSKDVETGFEEDAFEVIDRSPGPEVQLAQSAHHDLLHKALENVPLEFREIVVLRDLEGFSYKEIVTITGLPMGTVMSRLSRARDRLQCEVLERAGKDIEREL